MKWEQGDQAEIPDDEPLSADDLAHMEAQRIRGQKALIHRAAAQGMTPMEMMASGQVTVHAPEDALAFGKGRQLPEAETHRSISEEETYAIAIDFSSSLPEKVVIGSQADGTWTVERPEPDLADLGPLKARMEAWMAKDGGRSFVEGFAGYFDRGSPSRAPETEAVPPTSEPINDDEAAEGEIVDRVENTLPEDEDIVDAEVVEDDAD